MKRPYPTFMELMTNCTAAWIGLIMGILLGQYTHPVSLWLLARNLLVAVMVFMTVIFMTYLLLRWLGTRRRIEQ